MLGPRIPWWNFWSRARLRAEWEFGMVMNTERIIHRRARHELSRYTMLLGRNQVPYDVFRAAAASDDQAADEWERYCIAAERAAMVPEG